MRARAPSFAQLDDIDTDAATGAPPLPRTTAGSRPLIPPLPRSPEALRCESRAGSGEQTAAPLGDVTDALNMKPGGAPVKNVLAGSKVAGGARPHQLTIDADFVTCTQ